MYRWLVGSIIKALRAFTGEPLVSRDKNGYDRVTKPWLFLDEFPKSRSSRSPLNIFVATENRFLNGYVRLGLNEGEVEVKFNPFVTLNLQFPATRCRSASASRLHLGAFVVSHLGNALISCIKVIKMANFIIL